jgi:ABC-type Fe3+-hydroxamate transport system substrate-binding protein
MNTEWYEQVAAATRRREKAKTYLAQWQQVLNDAEEQLRQLALESIQTPINTLIEEATSNGSEWTLVRSEQGA